MTRERTSAASEHRRERVAGRGDRCQRDDDREQRPEEAVANAVADPGSRVKASNSTMSGGPDEPDRKDSVVRAVEATVDRAADRDGDAPRDRAPAIARPPRTSASRSRASMTDLPAQAREQRVFRGMFTVTEPTDAAEPRPTRFGAPHATPAYPSTFPAADDDVVSAGEATQSFAVPRAIAC